MMPWGTYGWGMGLGWIWMLLFWGVIIVGIAFVARFAVHGDAGAVRKAKPRNK